MPTRHQHNLFYVSHMSILNLQGCRTISFLQYLAVAALKDDTTSLTIFTNEHGDAIHESVGTKHGQEWSGRKGRKPVTPPLRFRRLSEAGREGGRHHRRRERHGDGAKVMLADIQDSLGRAVAAELGDPDTACYTRCNVTD
ncbi:short-chain dehydrogenase reductase 3a-like [Hordeum vulgare]|nr:short-chain dehydrogenase reductase 3a-like [Hordeum vulgare]